tara:strand:+ start:2373 stop:4334 length:1962 start_codon:yes stop_codon:yes gene_type:complete
MSSNVKRDHHTFTRDTITSRNTSSVTVEAQDHLNIQVGKSDGGTALSLLTLKDGAGNNVFFAGNLVDSVVPLQINEPGTGTDNFAITVYANGASAITTSDAAGTDAYLKINPDGYTQIDGTDLRLAYDDDDYHQITVANNGDITFKAYDDGSQNTGANFYFDEASQVRFGNKTSSSTPSLFLDNNKNDATGPRIRLRNARFDSGVQQAGQDNDVCGTIYFSANDDSPAYTDFGSIEGMVVDASNGSERGSMFLKVAEYDGTLTYGLWLKGTDTDGEIDVNIGNGTASVTEVEGNLKVVTIAEVGSDTDKILMSDSGTIKYATGANILSYIGGQASLTFGIADTNAVKIDSGSVADDEYARFTANGLESRSTAEVLSDIGAQATVTAGTNCTFSGATLNVDDAFIKNDADDTTSGTITAGGFTTTGTWTFDDASTGTVGITTVHTGSSFTDNDTSLMTAGAIKEKIESYNYGDITGVTLTADDTNTASDTSGSADFTIAGGAGIDTSVSGTTVTIAGKIQIASVTLDQDDMNDLNSTAVNIVAAQGSNKVIIPTSGMVFITRNATTGQTNGFCNFYIGYNGTSSLANTVYYIRRFMYNEAGSRIWHLQHYSGECGQSVTEGDNVPLTVKLDSAVTNDSIDSMKVVVSYFVYDNS